MRRTSSPNPQARGQTTCGDAEALQITPGLRNNLRPPAASRSVLCAAGLKGVPDAPVTLFSSGDQVVCALDDLPVVTASCLIASTPWSGSVPLCDAMRATGLAGDPRDYFNPLDVPWRSRRWGLLGLAEREFAVGYLQAVTRLAAGTNGVLCINLPWSHQRWLTRFARVALHGEPASSAGSWAGSDAQVLEAWYPGTRYVHLTTRDAASQAARWYLGRRRNPSAPGVGKGPREGQPPDLQEVRWIEELIDRQKMAWQNYFRVHGIEPYRIDYETFLENPAESVAGVLQWLGLPGAQLRAADLEIDREDLAPGAEWLPDYLEQRDRLSATIGVRRRQE
jgi:trehalose 2-sulfotransferase